MAKAKSYDDMSLDELEAVNQDLMAQKEAIREEQRAVNAAMDKAAARERLERMSDAERQALAQTIRDAGGIESLESVNGG